MYVEPLADKIQTAHDLRTLLLCRVGSATGEHLLKISARANMAIGVNIAIGYDLRIVQISLPHKGESSRKIIKTVEF